MKFEFMVLGANSATPMPGRFSSSFLVNYNENLILIDCGEGAQIKMSQFGVKRSKIDHILISHLHGDHVFGLPGLINSFNLNQRKSPLNIYGPMGIEHFVTQILSSTKAFIGFDLVFHEISVPEYQFIFIAHGVTVHAFPLQHRIPTYGYHISETHKQVNINPAAIEKFNLSIEEIRRVKENKSIWRNGKEIESDLLTLPSKPLRRFAYCSDTLYDEGIIPYIKGVNLLYHEATYLNDLVIKARERMHSTAYEAATIARLAEIETLVIGHYSSRYRDLSLFVDEAKQKFTNTRLAIEGSIFAVGSHS